MTDLDELKSREMKTLQIAEKEEICAYNLKKNHGWKSVGTAHDDIQNLKELGLLQPKGQTEWKKPYVLTPGLQVVTSKPKTVDLPIKSVSAQDVSYLRFVVKAVAQCAGTALYYMGSAFADSETTDS